MDIKQKFREEKNMDVYARDVTDGSFSNIYVKWLEKQLLLHNVVGQSEQLLAVAEYVYDHFDDSSSKTAKDYLQEFLRQ